MLGMVGGKSVRTIERTCKKIKEVVEDVSNKIVEENDKTAESVRKIWKKLLIKD